jgi:hypothetical protein
MMKERASPSRFNIQVEDIVPGPKRSANHLPIQLQERISQLEGGVAC